MSRRPEKCEACGFSSQHTRQQPGETPVFAACCQKWMCAQCRVDRACTGVSDQPVFAAARIAPPAGVPANDGIYSRIDDVTYHADPTSLSSSGARMLLAECPAIFRHRQDEPRDPKPVYDFGHAAHKMVLGEGSQLALLDPAVHGRKADGTLAQNPKSTGEWRKADAKAREQGKLPIAKADMDKAQRMAGVVHTNRLAAKLLSSGTPEVSGYWHDDATGVRLRFRPDFLPDLPGRMICVDYKTAKSANPAQFIRSANDYGYHQQAAWYLDGLREVEISDDAAFLFIVQEKVEPYLVSLVQLEPEHIELGRRQNRRAIELFAECQESGRWPGYGDGIHTIGLPGWAVNQIEASLTDA